MSKDCVLSGTARFRAVVAVESICIALRDDDGEVSPYTRRSQYHAEKALVFATRALQLPDNHSELWMAAAQNAANEAITTLGSEPLSPQLFGGVGIAGWILEHLEQIAHVSQERSDQSPLQELENHLWRGEACTDLDGYLLTRLRGWEKSYGYDLISGVVGVGVYFLQRWPLEASQQALIEIVTMLEDLATWEDRGASWFTGPESMAPSQRELSPEGFYNLGVAHGIGGIIYIISECYARGIAEQRCMHLLEGAVVWLNRQRLPADAASCFPNWVPCVPNQSSRLGWCYGDLGLAVIVSLYCKRLPNKNAISLRDVLIEKCLQRSRARGQALDAGLCHGAAGIAHLFHRLYRLTQDERCLKASRHWFDITLDMRDVRKSAGGFMTAVATEPGGVPRLAFLDGAAGVALALISAIADGEAEWDGILLMSSRRIVPISTDGLVLSSYVVKNLRCKTSVVIGSTADNSKLPSENGEGTAALSPESFVQAADEIASQLRVRLSGEIGKMERHTVINGKVCRVPLGLDLGAGLFGTVLFLAYHGDLRCCVQSTNLSQELAAVALRGLQTGHRYPAAPVLGAFAGAGGWIFSLVHLGCLWERRDLSETAIELALSLRPSIDRAVNPDLFAGLAGLLSAVLVLYKQRRVPAIKELMKSIIDRLLSPALLLSEETYWPIHTVPLKHAPIGAAHGISGIACPLAEAAMLLQDERALEVALHALAKEDTFYSAFSGTWDDPRYIDRVTRSDGSTRPTPFPCTWCWGAPGIVLSRLRYSDALSGAPIKQDYSVALQTILQWGFGNNHCLCHGDLGNYEPFLIAAKRGDALLLESAKVALQPALHAALSRNLRFGQQVQLPSIGFMVGLSGIGYGFLRAAFSQQLPSLLGLEGPIGKTSRATTSDHHDLRVESRKASHSSPAMCRAIRRPW